MNATTATGDTLERHVFTISGYGRTYELTEAEFNAAMRAADAVAGASHPMTTGEAAEMLGVSAKTVARLLDAGEMPFYRNGTGGHRMVELRDVVASASSVTALSSRPATLHTAWAATTYPPRRRHEGSSRRESVLLHVDRPSLTRCSITKRFWTGAAAF